MTISKAWELVDSGKIVGGWRKWTTADGKEFEWYDPDSRREALLEAAKHVSK
jgi:hypothetical protein